MRWGPATAARWGSRGGLVAVLVTALRLLVRRWCVGCQTALDGCIPCILWILRILRILRMRIGSISHSRLLHQARVIRVSRVSAIALRRRALVLALSLDSLDSQADARTDEASEFPHSRCIALMSLAWIHDIIGWIHPSGNRWMACAASGSLQPSRFA